MACSVEQDDAKHRAQSRREGDKVHIGLEVAVVPRIVVHPGDVGGPDQVIEGEPHAEPDGHVDARDKEQAVKTATGHFLQKRSFSP